MPAGTVKSKSIDLESGIALRARVDLLLSNGPQVLLADDVNHPLLSVVVTIIRGLAKARPLLLIQTDTALTLAAMMKSFSERPRIE